MSLICQSVPSLYPEELDNDIFNLISCYKFKTKYINILIKFYARTLIGVCYHCPLSLKLFDNALNIYSKVFCNNNNKNCIWEYLDVVDNSILFIDRRTKYKDSTIEIKSLMPIGRTILLNISNMYLNKKRSLVIKPLITLNKILEVFFKVDKILFLKIVNYFVDHMLDIFICMFDKNSKSRCNVRIVFNTLINGIIELEEPMREKLLEKFDKWFISIIRDFNSQKSIILERTLIGLGAARYYDLYLNAYKLYFRKKR